MTTLDSPLAAGSSCRVVGDISGFAALYKPQVNLVVWPRPALPELRRFARKILSASELESLAEIDVAHLAAFNPLPTEACDADPATAAAFLADLRHLAMVFADLTAATRLGVRLVRLSGPMCPRFHTDFVGVRLLTTYCGTGTEWLEHAQVDRRFLGHRADGKPDETSGLLRPGTSIQRLPEFAVALLKGDAWPGNEGRGVVHRSPAVRSPRILLSIDVLGQQGGFDGFDATGIGRPAPADHACGDGCGGHS